MKSKVKFEFLPSALIQLASNTTTSQSLLPPKTQVQPSKVSVKPAMKFPTSAPVMISARDCSAALYIIMITKNTFSEISPTSSFIQRIQQIKLSISSKADKILDISCEIIMEAKAEQTNWFVENINSKLPPELLSNIFKFLPFSDLKEALLVCR